MKIYNVEIIIENSPIKPDLNIAWLEAKYRDCIIETDKIIEARKVRYGVHD